MKKKQTAYEILAELLDMQVEEEVQITPAEQIQALQTKKLLTVKEASIIFNISEQTIYNNWKKKYSPFNRVIKKVGNRLFVNREKLEKILTA